MSCRLNVILDLDNTLIYTLYKTHQPFEDQGLKAKNILVDGRVHRTYQRPYLEHFLDFLFKNFNVGVLTAGTKGYADQIVWNFIQNVLGRKVDFILSREDVNLANQYLGGNKNMKYIFDVIKPYDYHRCNTILIDDHPEVHKTNPFNTLKVEGWKGNADDKVLLDVISTLNTINQRYNKNGCDINRNNTRCTDLKDDLYPIFPEVKILLTNNQPSQQQPFPSLPPVQLPRNFDIRDYQGQKGMMFMD